MGRLRGDRGAAGIEAVLILPVVLVLIGLAVYAGRVSGAEGHVQDAAQAGARAASLARSPEGATANANSAALAALPTGSVRCVDAFVSVDTSQWFDPGYVTVAVSCGIRTEGLALSSFPTTSIEVSWTEPVDLARLAAEAD